MNFFNGTFHKQKRYYAWKGSNIYDTPSTMEDFSAELYQAVEKAVADILGQKKKYGIIEVARYFQIKYQAFQISCGQVWYYKDTQMRLQKYPREMKPLEGAIDEPFDYDNEQNIALVIDTVANTRLRNAYPSIIEQEKFCAREMKRRKDFSCRHENPIFFLGTRDGKRLNSIYAFSGEYLIPELNHEFYFFYKHS